MADEWSYHSNCTCYRCEQERHERCLMLFCFFLVALLAIATSIWCWTNFGLAGMAVVPPIVLVGGWILKRVMKRLESCPNLFPHVLYPGIFVLILGWLALCVHTGLEFRAWQLTTEQQEYEQKLNDYPERGELSKWLFGPPSPPAVFQTNLFAFALTLLLALAPFALFDMLFASPKGRKTDSDQTVSPSKQGD